MEVNNIPNKPVDGEKEWLEKWQIFGRRISSTQYRIFSQYIGPNINIVPEDISHDYIEPILNPFRYCKYYADKNVFDKLIPDGLMPKTLLRKMNGFYYDEDYIFIPSTSIMKYINRSGRDKIIIKPSVGGTSGYGVIMSYRENREDWRIYGNGEIMTTKILDEYGDDFIIQEIIEQSPYISQFNPTSVNTLRLTVYRSVINDECVVTSAIMRIGSKGSIVDNAHSGGGYIGVKPDGTLCNAVLNQFGQKKTSFNGLDFTKNYRIPNYERVVVFAKKIGKMIPHHRLLALDIVLDKENQPKLIEFNVEYYSSWLFQYTIGPAFGDYTDEILDYCRKMQDKNEQVLYL